MIQYQITVMQRTVNIIVNYYVKKSMIFIIGHENGTGEINYAASINLPNVKLGQWKLFI